MGRRWIAALALLLPALAGGCGAAAEPQAAAAGPTTTEVVVTTTTTWPLSYPMLKPEGDYYDEAVATIGRIAVPRLEVDTDLHEGLSLYNIDLGPSHWPGSAMPGHLGNVVIAGHRTTHTQPFRHIDEMGAGDTVTFTTVDGTFTYEWVGSEVVTPDRIDIVDQRPAYEATLFACHPLGTALQRYVARFRLVGAPAAGQPDPSTLPT